MDNEGKPKSGVWDFYDIDYALENLELFSSVPDALKYLKEFGCYYNKFVFKG